MSQKVYNVVLSGGGVRGYAHIGALQALYEQGLEAEAVSATSAGALIGAFICDGFHPGEIKEIILKEEPKISFNLWDFKNGLLSLNDVARLLNKHLRSKLFEQLRKNFFVTATNLQTGQPHIFNEGSIIDALLASSAIPVLFQPVVVAGIPYADGGMSSNLPVEPFYHLTKKILGIHVNPFGNYETGGPMVQTIDRSVHLLIRAGTRENIKRCDVFIEPPELIRYHLFEHKYTPEIIETGYHYVKQNIQI